jgi:MOSC domain-containing protein YiiM/SAM-dependent methyltransferase
MAALAELADALPLEAGRTVVDLGAGTGKFTRLLALTGAEVIAVEPIAEMRAKLNQVLPAVETREGTAENLPLENHSVDAVLVAQAFHWFDGVRALSEIRRVLKPGGGLGLIWQARDASVLWVERLDDIINRADDGHPRFRDFGWRAAFDLTALMEPLQEATLDHVQRATPEQIVDRVASISYIGAMPPEQHGAVLDEVRALLATDPATKGRDTIELPHKVHVYWTRPTAAPEGPSAGVVLAVNTSLGGVPKRPIPSGLVRRLGVDGDRHSKPEPIHGGPQQAVCLLGFDAIERIRADGEQAFPGAYGENVTIAGLDWGGLRHGDRVEFGPGGPSLLLTDYATPCATQERWFRGGRTGRISARAYPQDARWYASVLDEGTIAPGDPVRLIRTA